MSWILRLSIVGAILCGIGAFASIFVNAFALDDYDGYGEVAIPGSGTVHLPKGEVSISFHAVLPGGGAGPGITIPRLSFDLVPPSGVADPDVVEDFGSSTVVNNDAHIRVWRMQVPEEGDYTLTTDGDVTAYVEPRLAFGSGSSYWWVTWLLAALVPVLLLVSLVSGIFAGRRTFMRARRRADAAIAFPPIQPGQTAPTPGPPSLSSLMELAGQTAAGTATALATAPPAAAPHGSSLAELTKLHAAGSLTDEEFEKAKRLVGG